MSEGEDKREHSTKPEVDDLTDYQALNSLGGAAVAGELKDTAVRKDSKADAEVSDKAKPETKISPGGDYNDGADFVTVDNKGRTNA
jgi:hypothetical protein